MSEDRRPYTTEEYVGGGIDQFVCEFCGDVCSDQTLTSWEPCCRAFDEITNRDAEIGRLRAENTPEARAATVEHCDDPWTCCIHTPEMLKQAIR